MSVLAAWVDVFANISQVFLLILGMFLVLVVLLQRGRGGGLAGAFGGAGGQSAFGTKAGDVFTKITIGIAVLWVITNGVSGMLVRSSQSAISEGFRSEDENEDGSVSPIGTDSDVIEADPLPGMGADDDSPITIPESTDDEADATVPNMPEVGDAADSADTTDDAAAPTDDTDPSTEDTDTAAETPDEPGTDSGADETPAEPNTPETPVEPEGETGEADASGEAANPSN